MATLCLFTQFMASRRARIGSDAYPLFLDLWFLYFDSLDITLNSDLELPPCTILPSLPPSSSSLSLNRVSVLGLNLKWHLTSIESSKLCQVACHVSAWEQLYSVKVLNSSWKQPDMMGRGYGLCSQVELDWNYSIGHYSTVLSIVKRGCLQKIPFPPFLIHSFH